MKGFRRRSEDEIRHLDRLQADYFSEITGVFEPPLPEGVPERLERIVAAASVTRADAVLDVGTGTGVLLAVIGRYQPAALHAVDLSEGMLATVRRRFPFVATHHGNVHEVDLPDGSIDVVFVNACYSNIVDKDRAFINLARIVRPGGRVVISHPMGRTFVEALCSLLPFPLDDLPAGPAEAAERFLPYGFAPERLVDEGKLYLLVLRRAA